MPCVRDGFRDLARFVLSLDVGDDRRGPLPCQRLGDGSTDASGAPGHDCHLPSSRTCGLSSLPARSPRFTGCSAIRIELRASRAVGAQGRFTRSDRQSEVHRLGQRPSMRLPKNLTSPSECNALDMRRLAPLHIRRTRAPQGNPCPKRANRDVVLALIRPSRTASSASRQISLIRALEVFPSFPRLIKTNLSRGIARRSETWARIRRFAGAHDPIELAARQSRRTSPGRGLKPGLGS